MKKLLLYVLALCMALVPLVASAECGTRRCNKKVDRHIHRCDHRCHNHHRRHHHCGDRNCTRCHHRDGVATNVDAQESDVRETASDRRARERRERHGRYHNNRHANLHEHGTHGQQLSDYRTLDAERTSGKHSPMVRNAPTDKYWSGDKRHGSKGVDNREHSGGRAKMTTRRAARAA